MGKSYCNANDKSEEINTFLKSFVFFSLMKLGLG